MGRGKVDERLMVLEICKNMSWDYWTYLKQPSWLIDLILMKQKIDSEFAEIEANKHNKK